MLVWIDVCNTTEENSCVGLLCLLLSALMVSVVSELKLSDVRWSGEGAAADAEGVETERQKEAGFTDSEAQVKDHGAGCQQAERWRIHSQWQRTAGGPADVEPRETAFHHRTWHPATGPPVTL